MFVHIDAKPKVLTYQPPAWTMEDADRDLATLLRTQSTSSAHTPDPLSEICAVRDDPDFKMIERATGALIIAFVLYMAAQFVRAWLEGHL